ncbi:MAG: Gfo/Idh/MocA family oxidoreductase [Lentisphaerae bacterium]|jgi:UDP-N-acetylglucosamine 3-dehydrogenase|nr:Gfo/Idh/MocA family oxidoreductase [Lentisphaerota bacterium]
MAKKQVAQVANEEVVRIGLLGAGSIALFRHGLELSQNPYAELAAVYDPITERAEYLSSLYNVPVVKSEKALIDDKSIDAVIVCTPNSEHARLTIAALKAGKHVLCEKPMATSLKDATEMITTAEKCGKKLMIGHNQCLMSPHLKAKQLLSEGVIGDVLTFRTAFGHGGPETWSQDNGPHTWFFKKEKAYVGCMGDLGVHKCYLIPWLLGTDIEEVSAYIATMDKKNEKGELITVDDNAVVIMKMANGVLGQLTASWTYYGPEDNITTFYGTKGRMILGADPDYPVEVYLANGEAAKYKVGAVATNTVQVKSGIPDLFVDCLLDGIDVPFDGLKGYKALAAVVACMDSNDTGKAIKVQNTLLCDCETKKAPARKAAPAKKAPAKKTMK